LILAKVEEQEQVDDIVYIQNVMTGRKPLNKAQFEQLTQQVNYLMMF